MPGHDTASLRHLGPDAPGDEVERAADEGPSAFGPRGDDLLRYGWASAVLEHHPELHLPWATSGDRAVRRAVMRSPALRPHEAAALVGSRRTGMHTLGANPAAPIELLDDNPGAQRRRAAIERVVPGGLADVRRDPDDPRLAGLDSGTIDLVVARAPDLRPETATRLAERTTPPVDPWVLAVLGARCDGPLWRVVQRAVSPARLRAARALAALAP